MRRYQVMLKEMKLLPDASITANMFNDQVGDAKGKRKATEVLDDEEAHKKSQMGEFFDGSGFVEDSEVETEGHEMLVAKDQVCGQNTMAVSFLPSSNVLYSVFDQ